MTPSHPQADSGTWSVDGLALTTRPRIGQRQIHLDFHTPAEAGRIGDQFNAAEFAGTFTDAAVDHVNLFAKCHHGWSYYPTELGQVHPGLDFDLFGQQVEACREAGLIVGAYYTIAWSAEDVRRHPEWAGLDRNGAPQLFHMDADADPSDPRPIVSWEFLCPSGPYLDAMVAEVEEIAERYEPDGFFFDICFAPPCFCRTCSDGMAELGIDRDDDAATLAYSNERWANALAALRVAGGVSESRWGSFNGTTRIYGNDEHAPAATSGLHVFNTHLDLEDLPTTWGGYDKLPLRARYFHTLGYDLLAISGKFHTTWGEFGGYKSQRALEYEVRAMIANGARCNMGDQLHPNGVLDSQTYELVGSAYQAVEMMRDHVDGARPISNLALCVSVSEDDDQGVARALLEQHREFVVVPASRLDPSEHQAVVLAAAPTSVDVYESLARYAADGGRILALGDALSECPPDLASSLLGITASQPSTADGDFTAFGGELGHLGAGLAYNYEPGWRHTLHPSADSLGLIHEAFFNRTYGQYFSHQNAPPLVDPTSFAAVHRYNDHLVSAHPLGRLYLRHGAEVHRSLIWSLVEMINPEPTISVHNLPPGGRVTVLHQPEQSRTLVHVLYATVVARGEAVIIDDVVPVSDVKATVRLGRQVTSVVDPLSGRERPHESEADGSLTIHFPTVEMHAVAELRH